MAPTFLAAVTPAAVSEATFVKPRILRFSCSPLRIFSKLRGISLPMLVFLSGEKACQPDGQHAHASVVVSDGDQAHVLVFPNTNPIRLILQLGVRRRIT